MFDLHKEFTILRQATPHQQQTERDFQQAAIRQARTAADVSNKHGNGNLNYRTRKNPLRTVSCEVAPTYVDNQTASLRGLGRVRLAGEQPYQYPNNRLYGARSFRLADVSPYGNANTWRLYITYKLPDAEPRTTGLAVGHRPRHNQPDGGGALGRARRLLRHGERVQVQPALERCDAPQTIQDQQTFAQLSGDGAPARPPQPQERLRTELLRVVAGQGGLLGCERHLYRTVGSGGDDAERRKQEARPQQGHEVRPPW